MNVPPNNGNLPKVPAQGLPGVRPPVRGNPALPGKTR